MYLSRLENYIVETVLRHLHPYVKYSEGAKRLMFGTSAKESDSGKYVSQIGSGIAKSPWQIEEETFVCTYENFLNYRPLLKERVDFFNNGEANYKSLTYNPYYACAIARIKYFRSPRAIPHKDDVEGMAKMWRYDYNSTAGAFDNEAAIKKFIKCYNKYVLPFIKND